MRLLRYKSKIDLSPKLKLGVGRGFSKVKIFKTLGYTFLAIAIVLLGNSVMQLLKPSKITPQVLGAQSQNPTPESPEQFIIYKVQKGDTLYSIAKAHNIAWTVVATINNLEPPFNIKLNQEIKVPKQ